MGTQKLPCLFLHLYFVSLVIAGLRANQPPVDPADLEGIEEEEEEEDPAPDRPIKQSQVNIYLSIPNALY